MSQSDIAQEVGITQSAVAQFERGESALSRDKFIQMAPLLNINPKFLETSTGNPFKPNVAGKTIELILKTTLGDQVDFTPIKYIADYNSKAHFLFFKPMSVPESDEMRVRKWQRKGMTTFGIGIRDSDGNTFFAARKQHVFFNEQEILQHLQKQAEEDKKEFHIRVASISEEEYEKMKMSSFQSERVFSLDEIRAALFDEEDFKDDRKYLEGLVDRVTVFDENHETESKRMKEKLE